jgi:hypothetical protein
MTLAGHAGHTDPGRQLFIPREPMFTPGKLRFIQHNRMFTCGLPDALAVSHR